MPVERDCREIVLYSVLKSLHRGLSDGFALDRPPSTGTLCVPYPVKGSWAILVWDLKVYFFLHVIILNSTSDEL